MGRTRLQDKLSSDPPGELRTGRWQMLARVVSAGMIPFTAVVAITVLGGSGLWSPQPGDNPALDAVALPVGWLPTTRFCPSPDTNRGADGVESDLSSWSYTRECPINPVADYGQPY
jgi:hypothetical protein